MPLRGKRLSDQEKIELIKDYTEKGFTGVELGKKYGVYPTSALSLLRRRGIPPNATQSQLQRKYKLNEEFFDIIDTQEKAYFLGLLFADGSHNTKIRNVCLGLQKRDKKILYKLRKTIGSNRPLNIEYRNKKNPKHQDLYKLQISSLHISNSLLKLGMLANKSLTIQFPREDQVPKHLRSHFIRGYMDGDGSLGFYYDKNNQCYVLALRIISNIKFCKEIQQIIFDQIGIRGQVYQKNNCIAGIGFFQCNGHRIVKILDWIYQDASICLDRKYKIYLKMKERINTWNRQHKKRL